MCLVIVSDLWISLMALALKHEASVPDSFVALALSTQRRYQIRMWHWPQARSVGARMPDNPLGREHLNHMISSGTKKARKPLATVSACWASYKLASASDYPTIRAGMT